MIVPARRYSVFARIGAAAALLVVLAGFIAPLPAAAAWPPYPDPAVWPVTVAERVRFHIQPVRAGQDLPQADLFSTEFYPRFDAAIDHVETVLGLGTSAPIEVDVYTSSAQFRGRQVSSGLAIAPHTFVRLDAGNGHIIVDMPNLLAASPAAADDAIRNAMTQRLLQEWAGTPLPPLLQAGLALYLELPTTEYLARLATTIDGAVQGDLLYTWFDLFTIGVPGDDLLALAESYSVTAFLVNRYDIPSLRLFLSSLAEGATWTDAVRTAFQTDAASLEGQWEANLPAWATSGWRDNLMASFDLEPARAMLDQGQYVSAKAMLGPAQNLYRQLDDKEALAEVQRLIGQADTGIQAEALMAEIQLALEAFDYPRALNLLDQVDTQFALLPADQVPTGLLDTYRQIATDGSIALGQLETASNLADSWGRYPEARKAARDAGNTFARLGDGTRQAEAVAVVDKLDNRQRRLVVLLSGLGILTLCWLAFWL
ncbi:MAG: hypothetical protein M3Y37_03560, partial [Chloroflexota bacterium]|nr:hypothetical protein [Chloroflexota bacterium]